MQTLKEELISNWRKTVEAKKCIKSTCGYVYNDIEKCLFCPLNINYSSSAVCTMYKEFTLTKQEWKIIFDMLENIPAKYYTKSEFKRSKFTKVYNKLMEMHNASNKEC